MSVDEILGVQMQEGYVKSDIEDFAPNASQDEVPASSPEENEETETAPSQEGAEEPVEETVESTEETTDDAEASEEESDDNTPDEEDVPFHKHPRFKKVIAERKEFKSKAEQLEKEIADIKKALEAKEESKSEPIPQWAKDHAEEKGYDPKEFWTAYQQQEKQKEEAIESRVLEKLKAEQAKEQEESARWQSWINEQMEEIGEEIGEDLTDTENSIRNEILKVATEYQPSDADGNIDLRKSYELWKVLKQQPEKKKAVAKKKVAAITTERDNKDATAERTYFTPADLKKSIYDIN